MAHKETSWLIRRMGVLSRFSSNFSSGVCFFMCVGVCDFLFAITEHLAPFRKGSAHRRQIASQGANSFLKE